MTNRENPVWQMTYAVEFTHQLRSFLLTNGWPDSDQLSALINEASTVADTAVETLGEPQPQFVTPPQPRDESRDVWLWTDTHRQWWVMPWERRSVPGSIWPDSIMAGEHYVPYSQLEAALAKPRDVDWQECPRCERDVASTRANGLCGDCDDATPSDSELLDAILCTRDMLRRAEELAPEQRTPKALDNLRARLMSEIDDAITERAKR